MSEYVFNTASISNIFGRHAAKTIVEALVKTLVELESDVGLAQWPLKLPVNAWELEIALDATGVPIVLGEIIDSFYSDIETRELAVFFDALMCYAPAVEQLDDAAIEAVLRLSPISPAQDNEANFQAVSDAGLDAMQCVVTGGVLVSFDHEKWNFDRGVVAVGRRVIEFDHAAKLVHVDAIAQRRLLELRASLSRRNFASFRERAFPSLTWGRDVLDHIECFPAAYLKIAFERLASLNDVATAWKTIGTALPVFGNLAPTDESVSTMQQYGHQRLFRSPSGVAKSYETHVWIDPGNRLHFAVDHGLKTIEIGYLGPHLDTVKFH